MANPLFVNLRTNLSLSDGPRIRYIMHINNENIWKSYAQCFAKLILCFFCQPVNVRLQHWLHVFSYNLQYCLFCFCRVFYMKLVDYPTPRFVTQVWQTPYSTMVLKHWMGHTSSRYLIMLGSMSSLSMWQPTEVLPSSIWNWMHYTRSYEILDSLSSDFPATNLENKNLEKIMKFFLQ